MKATTTPVSDERPCEYDRSRTYGWNGENRLISAENGDTRLEFSYDYMGRRFEKKVYTANVLTKHEKFVYDGYKLIQVLDALNSDAVTMTFVWHPESTGLDTPFSMTYNGEIYYYVTDGNKNVTALLDADGNRAAEYIYHPFGTIYSKTGPMVDLNPFRFSSEQYDDETGLVYYNYRYYSPELGRWISRDPIEEEGGVNLYAMVGNNPSNCWDHLGENVWVLYGSSSAKTGHMAVIIGPRSGRGIFSYFSFAPDGLTTYDRRTYDEILNYVQGTRDGHPYTHYLFYCTNETQDAEARRAAGRYRHYVYLQPNVCTNLAHDAVVATGKIFVIKHTPASTYNHNRNVADGYGGL